MGRNSKESGVALIFALGILTMLLSLGVAFVLNMMAENRIATQLECQLRSEMAALGGVERAIAELRNEMPIWATANRNQRWFWQSDNSPSYGVGGSNPWSGTLGVDPRPPTYALTIKDSASMINVNDSNPRLWNMLTCLPGLGPPVFTGDVPDGHIVGGIRTYRNGLPGHRFVRKAQLLGAPGIGEAIYAGIKDFVTLDSYQDVSMVSPDPITRQLALMPRSPVNVNTAPREVLRAVIAPVFGDTALANVVAGGIETWRNPTTPPATWPFFSAWTDYSGAAPTGGFNNYVDALTPAVLTDVQRLNLRSNANPNRIRMEGTGADKPSTEFCFHAGGNFEITSVGITRALSSTTTATTTVSTTVPLFRIFNVTRKEDFVPAPTNPPTPLAANIPEWYRVTCQDGCPVNFTDDLDNGYAANYQTINDALKVGFWDDFGEETPAYTANMFRRVSGGNSAGYTLQGAGHNQQFLHTNSAGDADIDSYFGDFDITYLPAGQTIDSWEWQSFYLKVWNQDEADGTRAGTGNMRGAGDVGYLVFRKRLGVDSQAYGRNAGLHYAENEAGSGEIGKYIAAMVYEIPDSSDNKGTNNWFEGDNLKEERLSAKPYLREIDGREINKSATGVKLNLHGSAPPKAVDDSLGRCSLHIPAHYRYYLRKPEGGVIANLAGGGPDGRVSPNFLFPAPAYTYQLEKWYRLRVFHRNPAPGAESEGVSLEISNGAGTPFHFPSSTVADNRGETFSDDPLNAELNTWINERGLVSLRNSNSLSAWDNLRIICPWGDYRSGVIDRGTSQGQWGTISWTRTVPLGSDPATEIIRMDAINSAANDMSSPSANWSLNMPADWTNPHFPDTEPALPVAMYNGDGTGQSFLLAGRDQRFLQFRAYIGSTRPNADAGYCRHTPVLEDVTLTFFPGVKVPPVRRGNL